MGKRREEPKESGGEEREDKRGDKEEENEGKRKKKKERGAERKGGGGGVGFGHIPMPSNLGFSSCFYWVLYVSQVSFKWVLMIILYLLFKLC